MSVIVCGVCRKRVALITATCLLLLSRIPASLSNAASDQDSDAASSPLFSRCPATDATCRSDPVGFVAIAQLHSQIDDDHDGKLDREESFGFIHDDLQHDSSAARRQSNLHGADDQITVHDLWKLWVSSEVYNWTVDEVLDWLLVNVELPQYSSVFTDKSISGRELPRLSATPQFCGSALGVKNPVHRQKLTVKATDLVLFGPPKTPHNYKKDAAVLVSILVAMAGCYFAYVQQKAAKIQVQRATKDMSTLRDAENALRDLQRKLETAQKEQQDVIDDKQSLEQQLKDEIRAAKAEAERLKRQEGAEGGTEKPDAAEELNRVRAALADAEKRLHESYSLSSATTPDLQHWLRRTYEVESKYFENERSAAEHQLRAAKEMCDKIRKQKGKFLGSIRVAHTTSLDKTDQRISDVRAALESVKAELQERTHRWKQIERCCGFGIVGSASMPSMHSLSSRSNLSEDAAAADDSDAESISSASRWSKER